MELAEQINQTKQQLKNRDIVIIGLQPWYFPIGSNCKNIALHFSKNNRVLYVNTPLNRKTYLLKNQKDASYLHYKILKEKEDKIKQISENLWEYYPETIIESINKIPFTKVFSAINYINNRRFAKDIKKAIKKLDFKDVILFNDNDFYNGFYLKNLLLPSLYIYYSRDFLQGYKFFRKHGKVLEPELIKKTDVVVTNSTFLANYCSQFNSKSFYVGQGCDLSLFDHRQRRIKPKELETISAPIIGYVGALNSERLDIELLEFIAVKKPDWQIVLVGPEDEQFLKSDLHKLTNVYFTGKKPIEQLADFVNFFDVCINPQMRNNITEANYPLKIDEYLSMGKPVVATATTTMELFAGYTYLATTPYEYISLIELAIKEDNPTKQQERISFAKKHTWENCMDALYNVINNYQN